MRQTRILFVCHGNICRSPMAEYVFKDIVKKAGREEEFCIASAAVSREAVGGDIYYDAKAALREHGIPFSKHRAHQVTEEEMRSYDLVIIMDESNRQYIKRMFGEKYREKVHLLMEYTGRSRSVSDPWYTDDYDTAIQDILAGCKALYAALP